MGLYTDSLDLIEEEIRKAINKGRCIDRKYLKNNKNLVDLDIQAAFWRGRLEALRDARKIIEQSA
jgi:hypothetical protein